MNKDESKKAPRITIVLTSELDERLRKAAARAYTPPSVLARQWIVRCLEEEEKR